MSSRPTITPGAYLKMRRCAARLSVADVAARISTAPRLAEFARAELIDLIEADAAPASFETIVVLNNVYRFDLEVLATLARISLGADLPMPEICKICACAETDPCHLDDGWECDRDEGTLPAASGVCSACFHPEERP